MCSGCGGLVVICSVGVSVTQHSRRGRGLITVVIAPPSCPSPLRNGGSGSCSTLGDVDGIAEYAVHSERDRVGVGQVQGDGLEGHMWEHAVDLLGLRRGGRAKVTQVKAIETLSYRL